MAAPPSAALNAEPANPGKRKEKKLKQKKRPEKSYADAVHEEPPAEGTKQSVRSNRANDSTDDGSNGAGEAQHKASVLKIVDTGAPEAKDSPPTRPAVDRQASKVEFTATVSTKCSSRY